MTPTPHQDVVLRGLQSGAKLMQENVDAARTMNKLPNVFSHGGHAGITRTYV